MRLIIDLQSCQSQASKNRGIGRYSYSFVEAMLKEKNDDTEIYLFVSSLYPSEVDFLKSRFGHHIHADNFIIWEGYNRISHVYGSKKRAEEAIYSRATVLRSYKPDVILVTSLFEGLDEDITVDTKLGLEGIKIATVLYDLIPYQYPDIYLSNPIIKDWYMGRLDSLAHSDLLLSISNSSKMEADTILNSKHKIINISSAVSENFKVIESNPEKDRLLRNKFSLKDCFILYTGGVDHRKNIKNLILAFSKLSRRIIDKYSLAIVCSINDKQRQELISYSIECGLLTEDVSFTGYVSEDELVQLYNLTSLFVFPSWHEGFGLPVLEAMKCGSVVVCSNCSSLPEVIGFEEALFDPYDVEDITNKINLSLTDDDFRERFKKHAMEQVKLFSWKNTAKIALGEIAWLNEDDRNIQLADVKKLRLAFVTPLPPIKSGISYYSYLVIKEIEKFYDVTVVVDDKENKIGEFPKDIKIIGYEQFKNNYKSYERVIYQFGNSEYHAYMYTLCQKIHGIVVLHDFYLSGLVNWMSHRGKYSVVFENELKYSHSALTLRNKHKNLVEYYPCNKRIVDSAIGVIVHSQYSLDLADEWLGKVYSETWKIIPLLLDPYRTSEDKTSSRRHLSIPQDAFITTTYGHLGETKMNLELLKAWENSECAKSGESWLIFAGELVTSNYQEKLQAEISKSRFKDRIIITGWLDDDSYRQYLSATDIAVQLRTSSRGETSAAVLDCMSEGKPLIVNMNGSSKYLDDSVCFKINDSFKESELTNVIDELYNNRDELENKGNNVREFVNKRHDKDFCVSEYVKYIESSYAQVNIKRNRNLKAKIALIAKRPIKFLLTKVISTIEKKPFIKEKCHYILRSSNVIRKCIHFFLKGNV
ncbi:glycosyltransferase [Vibrio cholerae]|uniref:glycosyltransferase n=3 Tax=Vibrio cholerae TaxID=666 RepID=UPI0007097846|nr:glycosyltransferase [Vibrio cholerae]EKY3318380.1 glycosyltransferase [Vibrio cholerae]QKV04781.1 glycosyltransferase [Vibrio cholerae]